MGIPPPRLWVGVRFACGIFNVVLGVLLLASVHRLGSLTWLAALPLAGAALIFWTVYRLQQDSVLRVRELEESRASLVEDSAARLRRIERDLHDGAQAQMVAVAMKLGLAREKLGGMIDGPAHADLERVLDLIDAAHRGAKEAITELRDLARGIHPPVLDHGLGTALTSLAAHSNPPVDLVLDLTDRGHQVVAAVVNAEDLRAAIDVHRPDVAVVDVRMPPGYTDEGLRAAIAIRRDHPKVGVLVFSQYIETRYTADLLGAASGGGAAGVGYLLKDRVADVEEFVEALSRVAAGGTALDPEVVTQLMGASRRTDGLGALTPRERDVLALMAEGRSNAAIAGILVVSERSVEKHAGNIFSKLGLAPSDADHRRVLAVLRYLQS